MYIVYDCFVFFSLFQKKLVQRDVGRLVGIQCYRGIRHADSLPCRGQRTHTNARTRRTMRTYGGSR